MGVTLFILDNQRDRAYKAVDHCMKQAKFGGYNIIIDPEINSIEKYSEVMIRKIGLSTNIKTDHILVIQWDGFIVNPKAWTDEFLQYDYIGAPWWFNTGNNVGNGGFSLRSMKLCKALLDPGIEYFHPEDVAIREHRPLLEKKYGIRFAPEILASRFSWEENGKYPSYPGSFGFHGASQVRRFYNQTPIL